MLKRTFDFLIALVGLVSLGWLVVLLALFVRMTSRGPGIFAQERVGRYGDPFICYKLRTMSVGTPTASTHETPASYVTPLGRWLRRSKLDELPQLWNVLVGEMSLVGPRPCLPIQTELVTARQNLGVLTIRPGITGLAQIQGIDMSNPEHLARIDAEYLRDQNLTTDFILILRTAIGNGQGDRTTA